MASQVWEKQFGSPALGQHRLLAFDLPGHGQSGWTGEYGLDDYKRTVLAFIEHQQLTDYGLVGLSLGGHVVLQTLVDLRGCRGVVAMTVPLAKPVEFGAMYKPNGSAERAYQPDPSDDDVAAYARSLLRPGAGDVPEFLPGDFRRADPRIHDGIVRGVMAGAYESEKRLIQLATVPVAVVVGAEDQLHDLAYLDDPNPALWRGKPHRIAGAGHLVAWEQPEAVNRLLVEFFRE
jgi:pimeloyl-ACP methyl ester carboxylesterase